MSSFNIYNSFSRTKEEFKTLKPKEVKMYCCGPTVYDFLHIGNFRGAIFYNFLRNWLEYIGYKVMYVYNFTDIDDKILKKSSEENKSPQKIAQKYQKEFEKDYASLKLNFPDKTPKATEAISDIIQLIKTLIQTNKAYEEDGDVFYSVESFKDYGNLSGRKTDELLSGARVKINKKKKNPLDFSLWKKSKPDEEWFFESPWGKGRPGWHIECTAMIHKHLGQSIDIHGGGSDLIFPHHENEIAQSESESHKKHVSYWVHNNMITFDGAKMSKSLKNIITMREFFEMYPAEVFKYFVLSSHYRSVLTFSKKTIYLALSSLSNIYSELLKAQSFKNKNNKEYDPFKSFLVQSKKNIELAFNDDLATPKAFAVFFSVLKEFKVLCENKSLSFEHKSWCADQFINFFKKYGKVLSLFQENEQEFLKDLNERILKEKGISSENIDKLVEERSLARIEKDFKKSDEIRKKLDDLGIEIQDQKHKTTWEIKKID